LKDHLNFPNIGTNGAIAREPVIFEHDQVPVFEVLPAVDHFDDEVVFSDEFLEGIGLLGLLMLDNS